MISIVLTAWKEERTIGRCVSRLIEEAGNLEDGVELILVCPDPETREAAEKVVNKKKFTNYTYIKDPQEGKPAALNLAFSKAKGEIIVSTDGDVWVGNGALTFLLGGFSSPKIGGVTGRPMCDDDRNTLWGYWGHMFIDAAHQKRRETLGRGEFYAMSGYLLAVRNIGWELPEDILDDVYFSYRLNSEGYKIAYAPNAKVYVKQPASMEDWMKQKIRSLVGYRGLRRIFPNVPDSRNITHELRYSLYPLGYARSLKELFWSVVIYPVRLWIWFRVWWVMKVEKKNATDIWHRIDSTK